MLLPTCTRVPNGANHCARRILRFYFESQRKSNETASIHIHFDSQSPLSPTTLPCSALYLCSTLLPYTLAHISGKHKRHHWLRQPLSSKFMEVDAGGKFPPPEARGRSKVSTRPSCYCFMPVATSSYGMGSHVEAVKCHISTKLFNAVCSLSLLL